MQAANGPSEGEQRLTKLACGPSLDMDTLKEALDGTYLARPGRGASFIMSRGPRRQVPLLQETKTNESVH